MNYFFIDAETDGLYGQFLSAAIFITNESGEEIEHFYGAVNVTPDDVQSDWVKENVLPYLTEAECFFENEQALLEAVWALWMKYRENSYAVSDVVYPVESRLFTACVRQDPAAREFLSPYPLLDLSTLLFARNIPWDTDRRHLCALSLKPHNALNDVHMAAAIWHKLL